MKKIKENYLMEEAFKLLYEKARKNNVALDEKIYKQFNSRLDYVSEKNEDINQKARLIGMFIYCIINEALNQKNSEKIIRAI